MTASPLPVVHKLLEAVTDPDKWLPFLRDLALCFEATGAQIVRVAAQEKGLAFSALYGFDDLVLRHYGGDGADRDTAFARYAAHFVRLMPADPRIELLQRYPTRPFSCRLAIKEDVLHSSEAYKQILDIADIEYTMCVSLPEENGSSTMMAVFRGKSSSHFTEADVERFGELVPFLRHAVSISERLADTDIQKTQALAALDSIPIGVLLATGDARMVQANATVRQALAEHDGIALQHGIVRLGSKTEERLLHTAIRRAVARAVHAGIAPSGPRGADTGAEAVAISRPSGKEPYSAIVTTLCDAHMKFGLSRPAEPLAAVFLGVPEQALEAPAELLQRLFGLTAAQARLCELIVSGLSLEDAASRLDVSVATARVHLKRVFETVGVHKQSELVAKVLSTPVWAAHAGNRRRSSVLPVAATRLRG